MNDLIKFEDEPFEPFKILIQVEPGIWRELKDHTNRRSLFEGLNLNHEQKILVSLVASSISREIYNVGFNEGVDQTQSNIRRSIGL